VPARRGQRSIFTSVSLGWSLCPHQSTMTILAMSTLRASHAITRINTIVDGTIIAIDIIGTFIAITIMVTAITIIVTDDRRRAKRLSTLVHSGSCASASASARAAGGIPSRCRGASPSGTSRLCKRIAHALSGGRVIPLGLSRPGSSPTPLASQGMTGMIGAHVHPSGLRAMVFPTSRGNGLGRR
jgi:hypothetical protein